MTAHRIHTNRAPMDYRSGIVPLDRPSLWRANWREIVGTAALSGATLFAFGLLIWSFS